MRLQLERENVPGDWQRIAGDDIDGFGADYMSVDDGVEFIQRGL